MVDNDGGITRAAACAAWNDGSIVQVDHERVQTALWHSNLKGGCRISSL